jgi:gas vesicle protein
MDLSLNQTICPITQEDFTEDSTILQIIPCSHCFSRSSLMNWFHRSVLCPVCRTDIRNYNHTNLEDISNNNIQQEDISNNNIQQEVPPITMNTNSHSRGVNDNITSFLENLTSSLSNNLTQSLNDLSGNLMNQISNNVRDFSLNSIENTLMNELENRELNLEYTIETTPGNVLTFSSINNESIADMFRRLNNR